MTRFAFFDVDDTLIRQKSMFDFYRFWALEWLTNPVLLEEFNRDFAARRARGNSREVLNRAYYRHFAGVRAEDLVAAGECWARPYLEAPESFFIASSVEELTRLKTEGIEPVFVSGSFAAVLDPIARHLGVRHILCAPLVLDLNGSLTGEIGDPQTIGKGKAEAIRLFLEDRNGDPAACFAFGDDISDFDMLACVGNPVVVGTDTPLAQDSRTFAWEKIPGAG